MSGSIVDISPDESITIATSHGRVIVAITDPTENAEVVLTPEQTDELIRALAAARVELSKARP